MKSIFDQSIKADLISRIQQISNQPKGIWGKMTSNQMLQHCRLWDDMVQGRFSCKRIFIGRIFGGLILKAVLKNEQPLRRNSPTAPEFKVKEVSGNTEMLKSNWINSIKAYETYNEPGFMHPFFGKMTKEQIGRLIYKHADHHLRQFGV